MSIEHVTLDKKLEIAGHGDAECFGDTVRFFACAGRNQSLHGNKVGSTGNP